MEPMSKVFKTKQVPKQHRGQVVDYDQFMHSYPRKIIVDTEEFLDELFAADAGRDFESYDSFVDSVSFVLPYGYPNHGEDVAVMKGKDWAQVFDGKEWVPPDEIKDIDAFLQKHGLL
jgi:hypothetical protein